MNNKRIEILKQLLSRIENNIANKDFKNEQVSTSTIGWQLDHSLKVITRVSEATIHSNPDTYKYEFKPIRTVLLTLGAFPRGKAKAPKIVLPPEDITTEDLQHQLKNAHESLKILVSLPKTSHFKHPLFGMLTKKQTIRFLEIHTKHHLKIIRDILKK